ncbi:hypothetical protein [Actinopolyspora mortivallis]|nr:hypothetical protein [Actinopolyspora mortivallis]
MLQRFVVFLVTVGIVFYLGYCVGLDGTLGYPVWSPNIMVLFDR